MRKQYMIGGIALLTLLGGCASPTTAAKPDSALASRQNSACLTETGSRIPASGGYCSSFGRSYSNEDVNRTGSTTTAGALRLLDPSISVH